jgi:hypothetical protein
MDSREKRWHSEVRAVLGATAVLALLCVALIAQALIGTGSMVAILAVGLVVGLMIRYAPSVGHRHRRAN